VEVWLHTHTHFDLGTRWRWVVSFTPGHFTPRERAPSTHWIGGWVGPGAVLDMVLERKIPSFCQELNPSHLIIQPIGSHYANWALPAPPPPHHHHHDGNKFMGLVSYKVCGLLLESLMICGRILDLPYQWLIGTVLKVTFGIVVPCRSWYSDSPLGILLSRFTFRFISKITCHWVVTYITNLLRCPACLEKKWKFSETVSQLLINFKKACGLTRREVLYNILLNFMYQWD
jgi:hypothetical protein